MVYYHNELDEYEHHYRILPSPETPSPPAPSDTQLLPPKPHSRPRSKPASVTPSKGAGIEDPGELPRLGLAASTVLGATLSNFATYPLQLIATRLQVQEHLRKAHAGFPGRRSFSSSKHASSPSASRRPSDIPPGTTIPGPAADARNLPEGLESERPEVEWEELEFAEYYDGVFDAIEKIYNAEGFSGFWAGVGWDTVGTVASGLAYWGAYTLLREQRKEILRMHAIAGKKRIRIPILEELALGIGASAIAKFVTAPLSTIVTRKQTAVMLYGPYAKTPGIGHIIKNIMRDRGITGFWAGYEASLLLTANPSITFLLYESSKSWIMDSTGRKLLGEEVFFLAAVCKALATVITYPLMVARSRAQMDSGLTMEEDGHWRRKNKGGVVEMLNRIVDKEGFAGLYEGVGVEILKGMFSHGLTIIVKEAVHRAILRLYFFILRAYSQTENGTFKEAVQVAAKDRAARFEQRRLTGEKARSETSSREFDRRSRRDLEVTENIEETDFTRRSREEPRHLHRDRDRVDREEIQIRETLKPRENITHPPSHSLPPPPPPAPSSSSHDKHKLRIEDWAEQVARESSQAAEPAPSTSSSAETPIEKVTVDRVVKEHTYPERDRYSSAGFTNKSAVVSERDSIRAFPSRSERSVWSEKPRFLDRGSDGGVRPPPNTPAAGRRGSGGW